MGFRSYAPFGLVAVALCVMGACGSQSASEEEDGIELPSRTDGSLADGAVADTSRPDTTNIDAGVDVDANPGLRVFVSSSTSKANLGGVTGADTICKNLATAAGLGGNWAAWLSTNAGLNASVRVTSIGPWRLVSGELVADSKAALISGTLQHAIDHDEKGIAVAASRVWTGTGSNGQYLTNDCDKWTNGGDGRVGASEATNATWTSVGVDDCDDLRRVYCFQL